MFVMFVKFVGIKPMASHFRIKHSTTEIHPPIGVPGWSSSDGKVGQVAGVYKKQLFGRSGGGKLIHFLTFWGRLIQFSHLTRVKIEILLYRYSIFKYLS